MLNQNTTSVPGTVDEDMNVINFNHHLRNEIETVNFDFSQLVSLKTHIKEQWGKYINQLQETLNALSKVDLDGLEENDRSSYEMSISFIIKLILRSETILHSLRTYAGEKEESSEFLRDEFKSLMKEANKRVLN